MVNVMIFLVVLFAGLIAINLTVYCMVWLMYFYGRIVGIID